MGCSLSIIGIVSWSKTHPPGLKIRSISTTTSTMSHLQNRKTLGQGIFQALGEDTVGSSYTSAKDFQIENWNAGDHKFLGRC